MSRLSERVYREVEPVTYADAQYGYPLRTFIEAWVKPVDGLYDVVADDPDLDIIGYGKVMDPQTAPGEWLPWLAQFTGTRLVQGETTQEHRNRIDGMEGIRRGSAKAMRSAATRTLTGTNPYVIFNERYQGSAYRLAIRTLASQTPNAAVVLADLLRQKPAGIVLSYSTITGITYDIVAAGLANYTALKNEYISYERMLIDMP